MKRIFAFSLALLLLPVIAFGALASSVPQPSQDFYVYDGAGTLSESTKELILNASGPLEKYCDGAQIVVVTIDYLPSGYDSEQYAYLLFNNWGVGSASANNGILLLHVVMEDRGWLAVGAGLTSDLTSDTANSLMDEYFWPYSDAGEYDEAVATLFPHLIDFFAEKYGTNMLYGGTGTQAGEDSGSISNVPNECYSDGSDYYYDRGSSGTSIFVVLFLLLIIVVVFSNSFGRRRYYRSYGVWPTFFFCGGPGPRGPRGPRPPRGPGPGPGGFGGGGGFRGGGFGGGGFGGGGGFHGGGFGGGGHAGGGGGRR